MKNIRVLYLKTFSFFFCGEIFNIMEKACFRNGIGRFQILCGGEQQTDEKNTLVCTPTLPLQNWYYYGYRNIKFSSLFRSGVIHFDGLRPTHKAYANSVDPEHITKTCLYNFDPLKPHFYIVKLGFTGVYIIFLISAQKHRLWVLVRTASSRRF